MTQDDANRSRQVVEFLWRYRLTVRGPVDFRQQDERKRRAPKMNAGLVPLLGISA